LKGLAPILFNCFRAKTPLRATLFNSEHCIWIHRLAFSSRGRAAVWKKNQSRAHLPGEIWARTNITWSSIICRGIPKPPIPPCPAEGEQLGRFWKNALRHGNLVGAHEHLSYNRGLEKIQRTVNNLPLIRIARRAKIWSIPPVLSRNAVSAKAAELDIYK
jgi:hypothetical protein